MESGNSIFHKELNLVFVYIVIFLFGLVTIYVMTSVINSKVDDINQEYLYEQQLLDMQLTHFCNVSFFLFFFGKIYLQKPIVFKELNRVMKEIFAQNEDE